MRIRDWSSDFGSYDLDRIRHDLYLDAECEAIRGAEFTIVALVWIDREPHLHGAIAVLLRRRILSCVTDQEPGRGCGSGRNDGEAGDYLTGGEDGRGPFRGGFAEIGIEIDIVGRIEVSFPRRSEENTSELQS